MTAIGGDLAGRRGLQLDAHRLLRELLEFLQELVRLLTLVLIVISEKEVLHYAGKAVIEHDAIGGRLRLGFGPLVLHRLNRVHCVSILLQANYFFILTLEFVQTLLGAFIVLTCVRIERLL